MSALPRPDLPPGAHRELVDALHALHHRAGWPSLRRLAAAAGCSHTTVSKAFSSTALPTWGTVELLVEAMAGDSTTFHDLWLAASVPPDASHHESPTRIAGRRTELTVVRRHLETGSGLLLVSGEAGIGKTKLVTTAAQGTDAFVTIGHCLSLSAEVPLMPIIDVLRSVHEVDDGRWLDEALAGCPAFVRMALVPLVPELDTQRHAAVRGELVRQHLFAAVSQCLGKVHELRPLGVVIEDLHWADSTTLDLVEFLVARPSKVPLVGTWRAGDTSVSQTHAGWMSRVRRQAGITEWELGPLTVEETAEQLCLSSGAPVAEEVVARLHDRSRGHPLFTEHLAAARSGGQGPLPGRLAEVLDRRFDDLGDDAVAVTTVLAIADRGLPAAVLGEVSGVADDRLFAALHELDSRDLIVARNSSTAALSHPLLAEAARRRLVPGEASKVHRALAVVLGAEPDSNAAEIAEHWRHAEDTHAEQPWRVAAAHQAHSRTSPATEAQQWRRALEIDEESPRADFDAVGARLAAFDAFELTGELNLAMEVIRPAMEMVDHLDDLRAAEVLRRVAMAEDWLNDDTTLGLALADRALERLVPHGATEGLVHTLDLRANHLMDLGFFDEAAAALKQALHTCEELHDDALFFGTSATLAWHQAHLGDLDAALDTIREARSRVPGSAGPRRESYMAMMHTDVLIQYRRPAEEVMAAAARAIQIGREWDLDFHFLTLVRANVVEALYKTGRVTEAAKALEVLPVSDRYDHWPVSWMAGVLAIAQGRPTEAVDTFRGLDVTGTTAENVLNRTHWIATALLWLGKPQEAWAELAPTLEAVLDRPVLGDACLTFVLIARAGADMAQGSPREAGRLHRALVDLRAHAVVDPLGPAPAPVVRAAATAQWNAELGRIGCRDTVAQWSQAATSWDALRSPHDAAYCRWKAAEVALRDRQGTVASRLLKRAAHDAREHVPLSRAIAATAAGTR